MGAGVAMKVAGALGQVNMRRNLDFGKFTSIHWARYSSLLEAVAMEGFWSGEKVDQRQWWLCSINKSTFWYNHRFTHSYKT
jgi:hypothetical protein